MKMIVNTCQASNIPPIISGNRLIITCRDKANVFANYFLLQRKPLVNESMLRNLTYLTPSRLDNIVITTDEIISK